jgi:RNA polymerase sigma-70 factor (ECF subfamily)
MDRGSGRPERTGRAATPEPGNGVPGTNGTSDAGDGDHHGSSTAHGGEVSAGGRQPAGAGRPTRGPGRDDALERTGTGSRGRTDDASGDGGSDEELFRRFRSAQDEPAFESLVHRYETELFGYLKRYLGSAEMAEDVFQATFLQVYLKKEGFDEGRRFRPWLYTIATNQAIDAQRRNRRHRMVSLDQRTGDDDVGALVEMLAGRDETADERLSGEEARQWVRAAVEDLPDTLRGALLLVYHQGMKYREAADVLGVPVGTVKSRLHSALLKLNQSWQASGNTP